MTDAKTIFMDQQYARSKEYLDKLKDLEFMMEFHKGDELAACLDEYVILVQRYGGRTEHSWQLANELEKNNESAILINEPLYLENGIPQAQVIDTLCSEGDTDMAKRIKQRVKIGDSIKWATGNNMQDVIEAAAKMPIENGCVSNHSSHEETPFFKDYLALYQRTYKSMLRKNTKATYAHLIKNHIVPELGSKLLNEITTADIQSFFDNLAHENMSKETIKKIRNIISPCFECAVEDALIAKNPCASARLKINTDKGDHHKPLPADKYSEITSDLTALPNNERRMAALLCYPGMRVGEILGLRWNDIDLDKSIIHIERGVTHPTRNQPEVGPLKTKASLRVVPMHDALVEALKPFETTGYILGGDKPLSYQQDQRIWRKLRDHYDLAGFSRHDFRDTCATMWHEQGIPLRTIQALLGHEDISTTAKYYTKVRDESIQEARKIMNSYGC